MSHFDFLNNGAENMFGDSSSRRKCRLLKVKKNIARKLLDRYVLEKMEDRWLPAVNVLEVGSQLQITLDAANDEVYLKRTGGTGVDNINITASSSIIGNTSVSGITSILVRDASGSLANQQLVFQDGSVGNFVSTIQSNSIEVINISTKLNGSLSIIGSGSQIEGSVPGSTASQVNVTNSTLTILAPQVNFSTLTSTNSTLNLTAAFLASNVTATDSTVSIANTVIPDFSGTSLTLNGGSLNVQINSRLNSLILNGGLSAPSANFASSTNITSITQNCGTLIFEGNVQNITLNNGSLTIRRTPGTVVGVIDNPKVTSLFNVNGGIAIVQDDANISGITNVNGTSTSLTIQAGANYSPVISTVNVNNGTVTVSNTSLTDNSIFSVHDGIVSLTDVVFDGDVSVLSGDVNILGGTFAGGVGIVGGTLDINGAILRNNLNTVDPVLSVTSGTVSVFNTTLDASPNSNSVYVGAVSTSVNLGNSSSPGNNTFNITSSGTTLFIENKSLQPVYALGNNWNYNGTSYNPSTQPTLIANHLFGASNSDYLTSTVYGVVYFNGSNIYVLNNQPGYGVNSVWGAAFSAAPGDTVYVYGGSNSYNETIELFKTLDIIGVANGTGVNPVLRPSGVPASYGYFTLLIDYSNPQTNVISNMTFDGSGLSASEANTTRIIDQQFFNNSTSCLTLRGDISMVGFNPLNNPEMIVISGGELAIDSTNTLESSILVSASGVGTSLQINAGTTVNGTLSVNPSADPISVNIAGTLNGNASNTLNLQCGTIDVTGVITGSEVFIDGAVLNLSNGSITSLVQIQSGNLNISGSSVISGSLNILGGNTNITGGTFTANTASNPSSVNSVLTVSGGDLQMSGGLILATENGTSFRDGLLINGSHPGYLGSNVNLSNVNITLTSSNNNLTSGVRVLGADSVLSGFAGTNITLGDGLQINGGNYSISLGGVNTYINANQIGNITLNSPEAGYIKLTDYAYYNDQTDVLGYLDASQVIFKGGSLAQSGYQSSTTAFNTSNLPSLFEIESKIFDYTTGSSVGFVSLYSDRNFAVSGRLIQRSIDPSLTNEFIYVQDGNYPESLYIDSSKSGISLIGPNEYGCSTPANLYTDAGSSSAILVEADNVQIRGMSIYGMNGTTNLLANGELSGTNFGITNFNGTTSTPIANLIVSNNVISHFINAGVLLTDNTGCSPSTISNNLFSSIGIDGFNGGVVLRNNAYASVTDNIITSVTNGLVLKDFNTLISSGNSDILRNSVTAYSTGLTVSNISGSSSSFTIGNGTDLNSFSLASGMNTTVAGPGQNETIGVYLQNISSSNLPIVKDNSINGFAYGYDITNVSQPITITGGSVTNATTAAFAVLKNQSFDPNAVAPGLGTSNLNVSVTGMTVNASSSAVGFLVDGNSVPSSAELTVTGSSQLLSGNTTSSIGAYAVSGGVLNLVSVTFDDNTYHNSSYGVLNTNATVNINNGANLTGFTSALSQNGPLAQTFMSGGLISGLFTGGEGILIQEGSLEITGGKVEMDRYAIKTQNVNTNVLIDSSSGNTSLSSDNFITILSLNANQITISQSGANATEVVSNGTTVIDFSSQGNLILTGGTYQNTNPDGNGILFSSNGILDISGGTIEGNASGAGTGISVSLGSSNITGVNITSGFDTGLSFTSSSGLLLINNSTATTSIIGYQTGIDISAGSANISHSQISSNYTGIGFHSTGQLHVSGNTTEISGNLSNSILVTNGTANLSDAFISGNTVGINFDGPNANGSISDITFSGLGSDLQLNQSGYGLGGGVTIGDNIAFSGSLSETGYILNKTGQSYLLPSCTTFNNVALSSLNVPANLSTLFSIQDKIVDRLDNSNFGLVRLKPTDLFITINSFYAPNTSPSIQRAIDAASPSDALYVQNGSYANESVNVNKTLSIYGGGSSGTLLNNETWTVGSPMVTISGFTFTGNGSGTAILANHSPASSSNLTLSDLIVEDYGVGLGSSSSVDLSNLSLSHSSFNNLASAVEFNGSFSEALINDVTFNNMSNTDIAVLITSPSGSLTVTNSCFTGTGVGLTANGSALTTLNLQNVTLSGSSNSLDILTPVTNLSVTSVGFNKSGTGLSVGSGSGVTNLTVQESNFSGSANAIDLNANVSVVCLTNSTVQNSGTGVYVGSSISVTNMTLSNVVLSGTGDALDLLSPVGNLSLTSVGFNKSGTGLSVGVGSGVTNLTVEESNFTGNANAIELNANVSVVCLTNSTVQNSGTGVYVGSSITVTNMTLSNVVLSGTGDALDLLSPVGNLSLTSVGFYKSGTGLSVGVGGGVTNLTVEESNFTGNANAIDLNANVSVVSLTNSTVQNSGTGVYVGSSISVTNMTLSNVVLSATGDALDLLSPVGNLSVTSVGFNKSGTGLSVGVGGGVTNLTVEESNFTGNANAIDLLSSVSNLSVSNTSFRTSGDGIFLNSNGSLGRLMITGSSFANGTNGIHAISNASSVNNESRLTNVSISNSTFSNHTGWGIDTQMLNDTLISNVSFSSNGNSAIDSGGIRLNLSNGSFSNITFTDSCFTDNGIAGNATNPGSAIRIDVAPDGALSTLSLNNLTIIGNGTSSSGLVGINLSGNLALASTSISNISITGSNTTGIQLSGSPNGSSLVLNNATFATSLETYIRNESSGVTIDATNATFGGINAGSSLGVENAYSISDKLIDGIDRAGWGPVVIKSGNTYVTPSSYLSSNSLTPSIQRAIDLTSSAGTLWIQGNSGVANYTGGFDTSTSNLTVQTGNETQPSIVNIEGNMVLSNTTTIPVRVGGTSNGSYTQFNLVDVNATSVNYANAIIDYSNISGFVPTTGEQFRIINLLNNALPGNSTLQANVVGSGLTVLQNESRYQLAPSQYFATLYGVDANRNDFVLVSVPQSVLNVVVYDSWNTSYFGDQVTYVDSLGSTTLLTYGVDAASNITRGIGQIEAPSATATLSIANGTYSQALGVYSNGTVYSNNLTINMIGTNSTSVPDAQVIGNITVDSIDLNQNTTLNYRVVGSSGSTAFDQINTNGMISLGNAIANIAFSGSFANTPLVKNSVLTLLNNTNSTAISGQFQYNNGTGISPLSTGTFLSVPGNSTNGFYSTYKFGTAPVFNDFSLIWNSSAGNITPVQVDDDWAAYDFGALVTVGSDNYVVGIDAYAEMKSYSPTGLPGVTLQGAVAAVTPTGSVTIANGTYNGTFTVNKPFALTGPSVGDAIFPASTGQTILGQSGSYSANVSSTNWTNNLRFGNILVETGTVFDNVASLIGTDGTLSFESGVTFSNVSLDVTRSMTIRSNQTGIVSELQTGLAGTGISASGANVNLTLTDLSISGSNTGVNLTNTGAVLFSNTAINVSSNAPGSIDGPTVLTLNYPNSSINNNLILTSNALTFSPFGSSNLTIGGLSNLTLNANLGTTSGSAGNNTISLGVNSTLAGGVIATGSGVDAFTISAPQPLTIEAGGGNDTLSLPVAGSYLSLFDGGTGVNTMRTGPNSFNYIDIDGVHTGSIYLTRGNTTTRSQFANVDRLIGNAYTDIFSFTSANSSISSINGGNGNDQLNFNGTSGANTSFTYTQQLEANITGSSSGSVNYFNFSNSTARVPVIDSFISVENIVGGSGDDIIRMQTGGTLAGSFNGGLGNNTLDYSSFPIGIKADLTKGSVTGIGGSSAYRVSNVRDVYGTAFNDILLGDSGNNILVGNDGNDSIVGNAGNDLLIGGIGADTLRGGAGGNIQIGGYVNFDQGGTSTAYGVPSQYVDFVLRSMMNVWSSVTDGTTFDTQAATLETTGVSVQVPGNTTSYSSIRLFSAANLTDTIKGSVFDDGQADTLDLALSTLNWIFVPPFGDTIVGGSPRKVTYLYKLIP